MPKNKARRDLGREPLTNEEIERYLTLEHVEHWLACKAGLWHGTTGHDARVWANAYEQAQNVIDLAKRSILALDPHYFDRPD